MYLLVARDHNGRLVAQARVTEQPQTIGRATTSALVLPSTGVSRTHASFYQHGPGVVICDEGSANGVKVDGQLITAPTLVDGTNQIGISSFVLMVELEQAQAVVADAEGALAPAATVADAEDYGLDFDTRLEAQTGAPASPIAARLQLVGRGGAYHRTRFALVTPLCNVGRDEGNEIVLEDPSISRRHAQLRLAPGGGRLTVLDLRSHNGTFLHGKRIKRAEAEVGAVIRFGDVAFKLERTDRPQRARSAGRRRLLALAAGLLVALLGAGGWWAYQQRTPLPPPKARGALDALRELQARIREGLEAARRKVALKEWPQAIALLDGVLAKDPLNAEARRLKVRAVAEQGHERALKEGIRQLGIGQREDLLRAQQTFARIPADSAYDREARYRLKEARQKLGEDYRAEGLARCRSRDWRACHDALCRFFGLLALDDPLAEEERLRGQLAQAERQLRRERALVPCTAPRYVSSDIGPASTASEALLARKYPVPQLRAVVQTYLRGNVEGAVRELGKRRGERALQEHEALFAELSRQLLIIHGKYQSGYSAYREKKVAEADEQWKVLLQTDAAVVPPGTESALRRDVLRQLGDLYHELGEEQFKAKRFREAYRLWARGAEVNARHDRLLNGLLELEKTAARLTREAEQLAAGGNRSEARGKLELAREICKQGSPVREEIDRALKAL